MRASSRTTSTTTRINESKEDSVKNYFGRVFDADTVGRSLGLPCEISAAPLALDTSLAVYYGGWSFQQLFECKAGRQFIDQKPHPSWLQLYPQWSAPAGYYRLLLPAPSTNWNTWRGQIRQLAKLRDQWQPAAVSVIATALLTFFVEDAKAIRTEWYRCAETCGNNSRVDIRVYEGGFGLIGDWDDAIYDYMWLAAMKRL